MSHALVTFTKRNNYLNKYGNLDFLIRDLNQEGFMILINLDGPKNGVF